MMKSGQSTCRVGVKAANRVVRRLTLTGIGPQNRQALLEEIDAIFGIDSVSLPDASAVIRVAYDATHCSLEQIISVLRRHGAAIDRGWWNRIKADYYRYVDNNIKENAAKEPWSCHRKSR